jgi:deazaflavin-dependent oxidoreductase (nitroreductase family)
MATTRMTALRPFVRRVVNPVARRFAGWLPGFGIVVHRGRTSGREYRTPVNVFRRDGAYLVALTYGSDADWVRNVLAADACTIRTRGRDVALTRPEVIRDPSRRLVPLPVRLVLALDDASEFLWLEPA